jgi:serine/threonine protein kinase
LEFGLQLCCATVLLNFVHFPHQSTEQPLLCVRPVQLNLKPQPVCRLRERFPPPSSFDFEARGTLSQEGFNLLSGLLQLNPANRITAQEALDHRWCARRPGCPCLPVMCLLHGLCCHGLVACPRQL